MRSLFVVLVVLILAAAASAKMGRYPKSGLRASNTPTATVIPEPVGSRCVLPAVLPCVL